MTSAGMSPGDAQSVGPAWKALQGRATTRRSGANELNRYLVADRAEGSQTPRAAQRFEYGADGNPVETFIAGDMDCNGVVNGFDTGPFILAMQDQQAYEQQYPDCEWLNGDLNGDGTVNGFDLDVFVGLLGSNNPGAVRQVYEWDAENRLTKVEPTEPEEGDLKVEFAYDYQGRRVEKVVSTWQSGDWAVTLHRRFIWDGWLMLLEIDVQLSTVLRRYTWGLDLSRDREGAGGIGGLLSVEDATVPGGPGEYVYFYDANGNVGQLVAWETAYGDATADEWHADRLVARYEYDPYGNNLLDPTDAEESGPYGETNPFRFSTRPFDDETGLGSWPARYYSPTLGRWLNRDPIGEMGGRNIYAYVANGPTMGVDPWGLLQIPSLDRWPGNGKGPGENPKPGRNRALYPNPCPEGMKLIHDGRPDLPESQTTSTEWGGWFGHRYSIRLEARPRYEYAGGVDILPKRGAAFDPEYYISIKEPLASGGNSNSPVSIHGQFYLTGPSELKRTLWGTRAQERRLKAFLFGVLRNPTCGRMYVAAFQPVWDVSAYVNIMPNLMHVEALYPRDPLAGGAKWLDDNLYLVWCAECPPNP